jgi:putative addiction module component (TIGR02574 family)
MDGTGAAAGSAIPAFVVYSYIQSPLEEELNWSKILANMCCFRIETPRVQKMSSQTIERLKAELTELEKSERAEIARFLLSSLDDDDKADPDLEIAWDAELARRYEEIQQGVAIGEPAEKVFAELRKKYP